MLFGVCKNGIRTHICDSQKDTTYFCDCCGSELIAKKGKINLHHFAHKNLSINCNYKNYSDWHIDWQNNFPKDTQEVIFKDKNGIKHIADVHINGITIEFQNSYIDIDEITQRCEFYNKLVWVVNAKNFKHNIRLVHKQPDLFGQKDVFIYEWKNKRFGWFDFISKSVRVFLDIGENKLYKLINSYELMIYDKIEFINLTKKTAD